jgi:TRAP-type mannitol/chloroaromatic compound transport system permease small subunit
MSAVGSVLICLVMLLICMEVVLRSFFGISIPAVADVVAASIVAIVFFQVAGALRSGRMVRTDIFIDPFVRRMPSAGHALLGLLDLGGALMFGIVAYASRKPFVESWVDNEFFGVVGIFTAPVWPALLVVVIGSVLTCAEYLRSALSNFSKIKTGARPS